MTQILNNAITETANSAKTSAIENCAAAQNLSIEQAVFTMQRLQNYVHTTLGIIQSHQKDLVRTRFKQGEIVERLVSEGQYGDGVVERLAQGAGISARTLWECRQLYNYEEWIGSIDRLNVWMDETEEVRGRINWTLTRNYIQKRLPDSPEKQKAQIDQESHRLEGRAKKLEHDAEQHQRRASELIVQEHEDGGIEDDTVEVFETAQGVATKARQVAQDTVAFIPVPKTRVPRSPEYLNFIRSLPCALTGQPALSAPSGRNEAHHVEQGGMGMQGSDYATIPVCRDAHEFIERYGHYRAEEQYGCSIAGIIAQCLHQFICNQAGFGIQRLKLPKDIAGTGRARPQIPQGLPAGAEQNRGVDEEESRGLRPRHPMDDQGPAGSGAPAGPRGGPAWTDTGEIFITE